MSQKIKTIGSIYSLAIEGKKFKSISDELKKEREKLFGYPHKDKLNRKEFSRFGVNIGERAYNIRKLRDKNNIEQYYEQVINKITQDFNIDKKEIMSVTRKQETLVIRQLIQYILYLFYPISFVKISIYFKQDHTTVRNSIERITHEVKYNNKYKNYIENLIIEMESDLK